jgi:predicted amidohydrolase
MVILPEMFSTGFSMEPEKLAEDMDGPSVAWMQNMARKYQRAICGSLIISDTAGYYNRFLFTDGKTIYQYDKRHLFSLLGEGDHYISGSRHTTFVFKGWTIQPFICYDLRFPAWCRTVNDAHLQVFVANWPERRIAHWKTLLEARAIENQCYVAGVNRIGYDNNRIYHTGDSGIYGPFGAEIASFRDEAAVFTRTLSAEVLIKCRGKFPFLEDKDNLEFR